MYRGRRIFNFISLVRRGGISCTNFTERNFGRPTGIPYGATKKGHILEKKNLKSTIIAFLSRFFLIHEEKAIIYVDKAYKLIISFIYKLLVQKCFSENFRKWYLVS